MKTQWMIPVLTGLFFALSAASANAQSRTEEKPPVAQPLVREGEFAVKLVEALHLGSVVGEEEAESSLGSVGIAPENGWIADYPVTPDILNELRDAVGEAADSGRLSMSKDEALLAFQALATESGLPLASDTGPGDRVKEQEQGYGQYINPTIINNYYYAEGPPVITYYPPPWDYYYLYSWVPCSFWWNSFWFSGFFILHDFHRVVVVRTTGVKVVSNHVFDRRYQKVVRLDPAARTSRTYLGSRGGIPRVRDQGLSSSQRGAASILERSRERAGLRNPDSRATDRGTSGNSFGSRRFRSGAESPGVIDRGRSRTFWGGGDGAAGPPRTDRRVERGPDETGSINSGGGSFLRTDNSGSSGAPRSFRSSEGPAGVFNTPSRFERRAFGAASGRGSGFSGVANSSSHREMSLRGSSMGIDRSFRSPSSAWRGSGGGFRGGGSGGRSDFAGRGFSGGGCRGRC